MLRLTRLIATVLILPFLFNSTPVVSTEQVQKIKEVGLRQETRIESKQLDSRALALRAYLAQYNSPLQYHAQDFIEAADTYGVDWRLVPAISGVESTFGKFIPGGHSPQTISHNGWGWGVYGDNVMRFKSWREAIFTITAGLKQNYINKGLKDPYQMNKIYASSPTWGTRVDYFLRDIEYFTRTYQMVDSPQDPRTKELFANYLQPTTEYTAPSTLLSYRIGTQ
jgi:hypothetical protein